MSVTISAGTEVRKPPTADKARQDDLKSKEIPESKPNEDPKPTEETKPPSREEETARDEVKNLFDDDDELSDPDTARTEDGGSLINDPDPSGENCIDKVAAEAPDDATVHFLEDGTNEDENDSGHVVYETEDGRVHDPRNNVVYDNWDEFDEANLDAEGEARYVPFLDEEGVPVTTDGASLREIREAPASDRAWLVEEAGLQSIAEQSFADERQWENMTADEWRNALQNDPNFSEFQDLQFSDSGSALTYLMSDPNLPGDTARERMDWVLAVTRDDGMSGKTHFAMNFNDSGFRPELQDGHIWPSSSNQVGHFLTAVDIAISDNHALSWNCALGHEQYGDVGGSAATGAFYAAVQCAAGGVGNRGDVHAFTDAIVQASAQDTPEGVRQVIDGMVSQIYVGDGQGNSEEDVRLTAYGALLGRIVDNFPDMPVESLGGYMDVFITEPGRPTSLN